MVLVAGHYEANADMMPTLQVVDVVPQPAAAAAAVGAAVIPAPAAEGEPALQRRPIPEVADDDAVDIFKADGLGVEGGRDLGRRMSIRIGKRGSMTGAPLRQFSKSS